MDLNHNLPGTPFAASTVVTGTTTTTTTTTITNSLISQTTVFVKLPDGSTGQVVKTDRHTSTSTSNTRSTQERTNYTYCDTDGAISGTGKPTVGHENSRNFEPSRRIPGLRRNYSTMSEAPKRSIANDGNRKCGSLVSSNSSRIWITHTKSNPDISMSPMVTLQLSFVPTASDIVLVSLVNRNEDAMDTEVFLTAISPKKTATPSGSLVIDSMPLNQLYSPEESYLQKVHMKFILICSGEIKEAVTTDNFADILESHQTKRTKLAPD